MHELIHVFLTLLASYFLLGLFVGLYFLFNAVKIDRSMEDTKKGVRFLLLPGIIATWPFFIVKFFRSKSN